MKTVLTLALAMPHVMRRVVSYKEPGSLCSPAGFKIGRVLMLLHDGVTQCQQKHSKLYLSQLKGPHYSQLLDYYGLDCSEQGTAMPAVMHCLRAFLLAQGFPAVLVIHKDNHPA
jgi:hypothetical protein